MFLTKKVLTHLCGKIISLADILISMLGNRDSSISWMCVCNVNIEFIRLIVLFKNGEKVSFWQRLYDSGLGFINVWFIVGVASVVWV